MIIKEIRIKNFKSFKDDFRLELDRQLNILVGMNEAGKSTIMEAIHLACSGTYEGKSIRNEISQNLFNKEIVKEYLDKLKTDTPIELPSIEIEIFFDDTPDDYYKGDYNSYKDDGCSGFLFKISYDEKYNSLYEEFVKNSDETQSLPIEYYDVSWMTFARKIFLPRDLKFKSSFIDSSSIKTISGCDAHFTKILRDCLSDEDKVKISQSHRKLIDEFRANPNVQNINSKIQEQSKISKKNISISVELQTRNAWENTLTTLMNDIPYTYIGKGEQAIIKTNLALLSKQTQKASIILIEEPENHLTYAKLNELINTIKTNNEGKQIILTTHSSFVANKLGLKSLKLLNSKKILTLADLDDVTYKFFKKISGYDTLRLILAERIILVEGDSDELIVQKAYLDKYGKLPIEDNIDVMAVGISFLRFLEIAEKLNIKVSVVTDNDGDIDALEKKYANYLGENKKKNIKICYDKVVDPDLFTLENNKNFNFNTLEPKLVKANTIDAINKILDTSCSNTKELLIHMHANKTDCALKIFDSEEKINYPEYILQSFEEHNNE